MTPHKATILVIDDDPTIRLLLSAGLTRQGYRVVEAADGASGLDAFRHDLPDLVLVDVCMPGMNGYSVVTAIRDMQAGAGVPVMMLTGSDDTDTRRRCEQSGADAVATKPFQLLPLAEHLAELLAAKP